MDHTGPSWELAIIKGKRPSFADLFRALPDLFPGPDCTLCFEGTVRELADFFRERASEENIPVRAGTAWPASSRWQVPATERNYSDLASLADHRAEPEIADHFFVRRKDRVILEWYDCTDGIMRLDGRLPEDSVRRFAETLGMKYSLSPGTGKG